MSTQPRNDKISTKQQEVEQALTPAENQRCNDEIRLNALVDVLVEVAETTRR